jgi:cell division protein FtsB
MSAFWTNESLEAYNSPSNRQSSEATENTSFLATLSDKIPWCISCLLILFMIMYIFLSEAGLVKSSGLMEKKVLLEQEILRFEEENRQLAVRLERIRNDPGYLEDEARRKLGLVRPNEIIYRLAEEPELSDEELKSQLD